MSSIRHDCGGCAKTIDHEKTWYVSTSAPAPIGTVGTYRVHRLCETCMKKVSAVLPQKKEKAPA